MKVHTTNYTDTFIKVAEDCPAHKGEVPPEKGDIKTVAQLQFEIIKKHPYKFTSDEVLFQVYVIKNDLSESILEEEKAKLFSKGQACFRASPLTKRYGWGIHFNHEGKMAKFGLETDDYSKLSEDPNLKVLKAMKSAK